MESRRLVAQRFGFPQSSAELEVFGCYGNQSFDAHVTGEPLLPVNVTHDPAIYST